MTTPTTYVARGPADLIAMTPFLLGFRPADSVVLLTFEGPESFHARVDLPRDARSRAEVVHLLTGAVRQHGVRQCAVLVFGEDDTAARAVCATLVPGLCAAGAGVIDAIRADGRRWWPVGPADDHTAGRPGVPYDDSTHPFTAARVYAGQMVHPDRTSLAASLLPLTGDLAALDRSKVREAAQEWADDLAADPAAGAGAAARWLRDLLLGLGVHTEEDEAGAVAPVCCDAETAGRVLVLVALPGLREVVCTTLTRESAPAQRDWWCDLVRRAPPDLTPGVAGVLALVAWLCGEGALAWCAIERARDARGDEAAGRRLADAVAIYLEQAVPPSTWRRVHPARVRLLDTA